MHIYVEQSELVVWDADHDHRVATVTIGAGPVTVIVDRDSRVDMRLVDGPRLVWRHEADTTDWMADDDTAPAATVGRGWAI